MNGMEKVKDVLEGCESEFVGERGLRRVTLERKLLNGVKLNDDHHVYSRRW